MARVSMNFRFYLYSVAAIVALVFSTPAFSAPPVPSFKVTKLTDSLYQFDASDTRDADEPSYVVLDYSWSFSPDPTGNSGDGIYIIVESFPAGSYVATLTVTDSDGEFASTSRNFIVGSGLPENQAPQAQNDFSSTAEGEQVTINVLANDSDSDGDTFSIDGVSQPANGSATIVGSSIRYQPAGGFSGVDQFNYTIRDARGLTDSAQVSVTVEATGENQPPDAVDDARETEYQQPILIPVLNNDSDPEGGPISIKNTTQPANGRVSVNGTAILYRPAEGFSGQDSFNYTVADASGLTSTARVSITVLQQQTLKPTASFDYSVDLLKVTFDWTGQAGDGAPRFAWDFGDGQVSDEENPVHQYDSAGSYDVILTVSDENGDDSSTTRSVVVSESNVPPLLTLGFTVLADSNDPLTQIFTATGLGGQDDLLFSWDFGDDTLISTEQNPRHSYTQPGTYAVRLTVSNAEGASSSVEKDIVISTTEFSPDDEVAAIIFTIDPRAQEGSTVTLAGSGFRRAQPSGEVRWRQQPVAGSPAVTLSSNNKNEITFVAPAIDTLSGAGPEIELKFEMEASFLANPADPDSNVLTDTAEVTVTVEDNGITAIPAGYISSRSEQDETPFGIKVIQGGLYLMKSFPLKQADSLSVVNRPRRTPLGLIDLELHADENGQAVIEFRLFEPLPNDYVWYTHSEEAGWEVFPAENSGDSIEINGDSIKLTLKDVVRVAPRASGDQDGSDGIVSLRTGPGQVSIPTDIKGSVVSGSMSVFMMLFLGLIQLSRQISRRF